MSQEICRCPVCGHDFKQDAPRAYNASIHPAVRQKILDRSLFQFNCPRCSTALSGWFPFVYMDMEHAFILYFFDNPAAATPYVEADQAAHPHYVRRVVCDHNSLLEKLHILEAGLDDRIIMYLCYQTWVFWKQVLASAEHIAQLPLSPADRDRLMAAAPIRVQSVHFIRMTDAQIELVLINDKHLGLPVTLPQSDYVNAGRALASAGIAGDINSCVTINNTWATAVARRCSEGAADPCVRFGLDKTAAV